MRKDLSSACDNSDCIAHKWGKMRVRKELSSACDNSDCAADETRVDGSEERSI